MNKIRNDKGYALLFVMVLVVLFTILGMGLFTMNMNAAKQFSTKEQQVGARHQAEMGVLHYKAELGNVVKLNPRKVGLSCVDLTKTISGVSADNNSGYTVKSENIQCSQSGKIFTISVESLGNYIDQTDKVKAKIYVENLRGATLEPGEIPEPDDYTDTVKVFNGNGIFGNGAYTQPEKSLHVTGSIGNETGNSNGGNYIIIDRNFYIDKDIEFTNHACLVTRGDLVVRGKISSINKAYIFVYGDAYFDSYTYTSSNNMIYISGDVYVNGIKKPKNFKAVPSGKSSNNCTLPGSGNPGTFTPMWSLKDDLEVDYFVN